MQLRPGKPRSVAGAGHLFLVNGWMISVLDFAGRTVSVVTTQPCCCGVKEAADNWHVKCDCVPIKLYLPKQVVGQI